MKTPQVVYDLITTFQSVTSDPVLGWDETIVGTYGTIRRQVTRTTGRTYTLATIGNGLTWIHKHGVTEHGYTICKVGPGNRAFDVIAANGKATAVHGNIYMLMGGTELSDEKWDHIRYGLASWSNYDLATQTNNTTMTDHYASLVPKHLRSTPWGRRVVSEFRRLSVYQAAAIQAQQDLHTLLS